MAEDLARSVRAALQAGLTSGSQTQAVLDGLDASPALNASAGPTVGSAGRQQIPNVSPLAPPSTALSAANGAAGNVDVGDHSYKVTFTKAGTESEVGPVSNTLTVVSTAKHGTLTSVPLGPAGTTGRNIYRTAQPNTGAWKFVGSIGDNTTTTFDDNVADSGLGVVAPVGGQPEADTYHEHGRRGQMGGGLPGGAVAR